MEKNSASSINIRKLWESAMLENAGNELIFMDRFSMSSRYNKHYIWPKVSEKGYVEIRYDNFSMFFVIALSSRNFYAIQGSSKAMQSNQISEFLTNAV